VRPLIPRSNPNLEDQGLLFIWSPPFHLSGMGDPTRSLCSRQRGYQGHWIQLYFISFLSSRRPTLK
jgi:hypothetical protein